MTETNNTVRLSEVQSAVVIDVAKCLVAVHACKTRWNFTSEASAWRADISFAARQLGTTPC